MIPVLGYILATENMFAVKLIGGFGEEGGAHRAHSPLFNVKPAPL